MLLRAVLRWGRRRHPRILTADVTGLFQIPYAKRRRLVSAAAARPSQWLASATWRDVNGSTVELHAVRSQFGEDSDTDVGLKTGARVALLLSNAHDRLVAHREALDACYGAQPDHALVFQMLSKHGPLWYEDGFPVEWSDD